MAETQPPPRRVRLRPERPWREHAGLYRDLLEDPRVAARLWPGAPGDTRSGRRSSAILAADIEHWQSESFGPWPFFETATGGFVGRCGLRRATVRGRRTVELLYAVRPELWGAGHATEMAIVSMAHARQLGLEEVVGFAAVTNGASRRVLEKAGMRFEAIFQHAGMPHWLGRANPGQQERLDRLA